MKCFNHEYKVLGKLVGNTGDAAQLTMVVQDSFPSVVESLSASRIRERADESVAFVLGRVTRITRTNMLFNAGFGDGVTELELLPGASVTGENLYANVELVGYRDPVSRQINSTPPTRPGSRC